ncbi:MAG: DUF3800 domain-containing protein [Magnetococcales bacterium]|nr:DUF3800 domain-containing protein [Magnetococcales bacterium]
MSWLLFIDESGQDQRESPYEVLAGVAIEDRQLWPLIQAIGEAQEVFFGVRRYQQRGDEAKGRKILKRKTYRLANKHSQFNHTERCKRALYAFQNGSSASWIDQSALAQAKLAYVEWVLKLCQDHYCKAFASIIPKSAQRPESHLNPIKSTNILRKDYTYLFERFHHFLYVRQLSQMGIVVFDELEKSQSHLLIRQMESYFIRSKKGRKRSKLVIPEPMFVHSDLTTIIQVADLVAYIISWGVKLPKMTESRRDELGPLADEVLKLQYHNRTPKGYDTWGFKLITSLIPKQRT